MLLGIQDEAYRFGKYYKYVLRRLNINPRSIRLSYRSSLAVIGYVGRKPYWIRYMSRPQKRGPSYATARIPLGRGEGITSLVDFVVISNIYLAYTISDNSKSQNRYFQLLINDESVFFSLVYEKEGIIVLHGEIFTVLNT